MSISSCSYEKNRTRSAIKSWNSVDARSRYYILNIF